MLKKLTNRGDTIIEVMISLTVLSLVLGASYASVNNSLKIGRDAEERSQATKLAASQVELIKFRLSSSLVDLAIINSSPFCMRSDGSGPAVLSAVPPADPNADDLSAYPVECQEGLYSIGVVATLNPGGAANVTEYHVTVRWASIIQGTNQVEFYYRMPSS